MKSTNSSFLEDIRNNMKPLQDTIKPLQDNQRSISIGKRSDFFLIIPSELPSTGNHLSLGEDFRAYSDKYLEYDIEKPEDYKEKEYKCCITHKELDEEEKADMLKGLEIQRYISRMNGAEAEGRTYPFLIREVVEYNNYIVHKDTIFQKLYQPTKFASRLFSFGEKLNMYPHFSTPGNKGIYAVKEDNGVNLLDYLWSTDPKIQPRYGVGSQEDYDTITMYIIFLHLLQSVIYIHEQNCVHRDIHPENIGFVGGEGFIKLDGFHYAVNTAGDMTGIKEKGRKGFYDKELYKSDENGVLIPPSREDLEFSDVYACGVTMIYIAERWRRTKFPIRMEVMNDFLWATSYEDRKNVLKRLRVIVPGKLKPLWKLYHLMLQAIKYCVVDQEEIRSSDSRVTSMFRRGRRRKSAQEILNFLGKNSGIREGGRGISWKDPPGPVVVRSGGNNKSKKTKTKKNKKKKTNKKKTKRI